MKKMFSTVMFAAIFAGNIQAQNDNLKRDVVYTLADREKIHLGKYVVEQQGDQNRFACFIKNTRTNAISIVFNGERILSDNHYFPWFSNLHYLNLHEENGYVIEYISQIPVGYVNIKGKVYGPFEAISLTFAKDSNGNKDFNRFYYRTEEDETTNYYIHYDGIKEGPFNRVRFPDKNSNVVDCEYLYTLEGKWYAHYRDGSDKISPINDMYCFTYKKNGKYHANINGTDSKGYDKIWHLISSKSGYYVYAYQDNGKWHVNINGIESRAYDAISRLTLTESGHYAYTYQENKKYYLNINGTESKGYDRIDNFDLTESGNYVYKYQDNKKWHVNINGTESKDYDEIENLRLTESGHYAYIYKENKKWYVIININGTENILGGYGGVKDLRLTENGKYAYVYTDNKKKYVTVNSDGTEKNSDGFDFVWDIILTESGKYVYFYYDNGNWYVNVNVDGTGKNSSGFGSVWDFVLTESGKYAYSYYDSGKFYVNVNINDTDVVSNGYDLLTSRITMTDEGNYWFYYENSNGKTYKNVDGKETESGFLSEIGSFGMFTHSMFYYGIISFWGNSDYFNKNEIKIYSDDKKHSLHSFIKQKYVMIDGKRYGKFSACHAWYDKTKNAFIWSALEGKELVVYEYKLGVTN